MRVSDHHRGLQSQKQTFLLFRLSAKHKCNDLCCAARHLYRECVLVWQRKLTKQPNYLLSIANVQHYYYHIFQFQKKSVKNAVVLFFTPFILNIFKKE